MLNKNTIYIRVRMPMIEDMVGLSSFVAEKNFGLF